MAAPIVHQLQFWPGKYIFGYAISAFVSTLVGVADILSRYKNNPLVALRTYAALLYLIANSIFGLVAFWFAVVIGVVDLGNGSGLSVESVRAGLISGFGAVLILRSVAFKLPTANKESEVGPSTIIDSLLQAFNQSINRSVAKEKDINVRKMMKGISFEKAKDFVPAYCLSLLERDEQFSQEVYGIVSSIRDLKNLDGKADSDRAYLLGTTLINAFGYSISLAVVDAFRSRLSLTEPEESPTITTTPEKVKENPVNSETGAPIKAAKPPTPRQTGQSAVGKNGSESLEFGSAPLKDDAGKEARVLGRTRKAIEDMIRDLDIKNKIP